MKLCLHAAQKGLSITSRVKRKSLLQIMNIIPFCDTTHGNSSLSFNITSETNTHSFSHACTYTTADLFSHDSVQSFKETKYSLNASIEESKV